MGKVIDLASAKSQDRMAWFARLQRNDKGAVLPSVANAMLIFANDPELVGMIAFNEFSSRAGLTRSPPSMDGIYCPGPFPRPWEEHDRAFCLAYLQRLYTPMFKMEAVTSAMSGAAVAHRFHPVRAYLDSLKWDGNKRIGSWLMDAFGAPPEPYYHAVGQKFLWAAVRRIKEPGCKFDSMLVLEGKQDIGKSRACRILFGDGWFTDTLPADLSGRDAQDALQGMWGIEFAEIEHLLRSEPEVVKAFLSCQVDRYRQSYGRMPVERPRQCVFIGTTNNDDYARDPTGNRRLWPVKCEYADADWVERHRDQLWAEAVATEPGAALWLDDELVKAEAAEHQASRHDDDPWEDGIAGYLLGRMSITIPEIMTEHLTIPMERQNKSAQMRVAKILKRSGWGKRVDRSGVTTLKRWHRLDAAE